MALHNWVFGEVFVPFGANAAIPEVLVAPPRAYAQALMELAHLDLRGEAIARVFRHLYSRCSARCKNMASLSLASPRSPS
jgi:hypothetical protein